jgi:hypothetical protein
MDDQSKEPDEVTAYRVGDTYELESDDSGAPSVRLRLNPGVRIRRSGKGRLLLYCRYGAYGLPVEAGCKAGWCRIIPQLEGEGGPDGPDSEDRACSDDPHEDPATG